jgi:UDP-glucose 4-epimerase
MTSMKLLLFGGEGFIGRTLKRRLALSNCSVYTFDLAGSPNFQGSVTDFSKVSTSIDSFAPDRVVNLAGLVGVPVCAKNPQGAFEANVIGAWNVGLSCSKRGVPLIHVSSTSVYGLTSPNRRAVTEDDPCVPSSMYGFTKYMGENAVKSLSVELGLSSIILRPSNVYGKNQVERNVIQIFLEKAAHRSPIILHGDGRQTKCFTYVDDVADAIRKVALSELRLLPGDCKHYNVSIGKTWSLLDLVAIIEKRFGKLEVTYEPPRKGDFSEAAYSIERIRTDFHFEPSFDLERGIQEILEDRPSQ